MFHPFLQVAEPRVLFLDPGIDLETFLVTA